MYRIKGVDKTFYGKLSTEYISDDHSGLDKVVMSSLSDGLNIFRKCRGEEVLKSKEIQVGVLSFSCHPHIPVHSSSDEYSFFDFYYVGGDYGNEIYVNGEIVTDSN